MYSPAQRAMREKYSVASSPTTFETDFFLPGANIVQAHPIPENEHKRRRESDEETEDYPDDNGKPISVNPFDNIWECLGRPNPKLCKTQYLMYVHKSAEVAQGEYHAKVVDTDSNYYVRHASLLMSTRYSMLVAYYREELEFRAKHGEKIPIAELFEESSDV